MYAVIPGELPKFIATFHIGEHVPIHTIIAQGSYIFVSHGNYITCFLVTKNSTSKCVMLSDKESPAYSLIVKIAEKILLSGHDNKISIWCLKTGKILCSWYTNTSKLHTLKLIEDDSLLCAGANNGEFKVSTCQLSCGRFRSLMTLQMPNLSPALAKQPQTLNKCCFVITTFCKTINPLIIHRN